MQLADLQVIHGVPRPVPLSKIRAAEAELGCSFPLGYVELLTTLGTGRLFGEVYVLGPREVLQNRGFAQRNFGGWPAGVEPDLPLTVKNAPAEVWAARELLDLIAFGFITCGDALYMHPTRPGRVYAVQGDMADGSPHYAGENLLEACRYVRPPFTPHIFLPVSGLFLKRKRAEPLSRPSDLNKSEHPGTA
ncbi:MAG TPA: SMI1/KNR4 family protein [Gemmata sp.]|jgi:hypothetical protein|nr:SMI1/KNR4 family protein [Gemmata sp.]